MRPIRLKERGVFGLVPPILGQRVLPFFMFAILTSGNYGAMLYFILYFLILGLKAILEHQILDYEHDLKLKVRTFATDIGKGPAIKLKNCTIVILSIIIFSAPIFFELKTSIFVISMLILYSLLEIKGKYLFYQMVKALLIKS
jgi:4-hydroxybenzoate polyprenyltransferase